MRSPSSSSTATRSRATANTATTSGAPTPTGRRAPSSSSIPNRGRGNGSSSSSGANPPLSPPPAIPRSSRSHSKNPTPPPPHPSSAPSSAFPTHQQLLKKATTYEEFMQLHKKAKVPSTSEVYTEEESNEMFFKARGNNNFSHQLSQHPHQQLLSAITNETLSSARQQQNHQNQKWKTTEEEQETMSPRTKTSAANAITSLVTNRRQQQQQNAGHTDQDGSHGKPSARSSPSTSKYSKTVGANNNNNNVQKRPHRSAPLPRHVIVMKTIFGKLLSHHTSHSISHLSAAVIREELEKDKRKDGMQNYDADDDSNDDDVDDIHVLCEFLTLPPHKQVADDGVVMTDNAFANHHDNIRREVANRRIQIKLWRTLHDLVFHYVRIKSSASSSSSGAGESNDDDEDHDDNGAFTAPSHSLRDEYWSPIDKKKREEQQRRRKNQQRQGKDDYNDDTGAGDDAFYHCLSATEWYFITKCLAEANYPRILQLGDPKHNINNAPNHCGDVNARSDHDDENNGNDGAAAEISGNVSAAIEAMAEVLLAILWLVGVGISGFGHPSHHQHRIPYHHDDRDDDASESSSAWWFERLARELGTPLTSFADLVALQTEEEETEEDGEGEVAKTMSTSGNGIAFSALERGTQKGGGHESREEGESSLLLQRVLPYLQGTSVWPPTSAINAQNDVVMGAHHYSSSSSSSSSLCFDASFRNRLEMLNKLLSLTSTLPRSASSSSSSSPSPTPKSVTLLLRSTHIALNKCEVLLQKHTDLMTLSMKGQHNPCDYLVASSTVDSREGMTAAAGNSNDDQKAKKRHNSQPVGALSPFSIYESRLEELRKLLEEELAFMRMMIPSSSSGKSGGGTKWNGKENRVMDPSLAQRSSSSVYHYARAFPCYWERNLMECIRFVGNIALLSSSSSSAAALTTNKRKLTDGFTSFKNVDDDEDGLHADGMPKNFAHLSTLIVQHQKSAANNAWSHHLRTRTTAVEARALQRSLSSLASSSVFSNTHTAHDGDGLGPSVSNLLARLENETAFWKRFEHSDALPNGKGGGGGNDVMSFVFTQALNHVGGGEMHTIHASEPIPNNNEWSSAQTTDSASSFHRLNKDNNLGDTASFGRMVRKARSHPLAQQLVAIGEHIPAGKMTCAQLELSRVQKVDKKMASICDSATSESIDSAREQDGIQLSVVKMRR